MSETKPDRLKIRFLAAPAPPEDDDPLVAAANPRPGWILHSTDLLGAEVGRWEIWHPLDLLSDDTIKLMSIERELDGATNEDYVGRVRDQVRLLVPDLPDSIYGRLSGNQLFAIGVKSWQRPGETRKEGKERQADAANPPAGEGVSALSSPSPHTDSHGATRT